MKLSIWDIYHALDHDNMMPVVKDGSATIRTARLVASDSLRDDVVYVTHAGAFLGSDAEDTLIVHRDDLVFVRGVSLEQVFDEVCDIIDLFNDWERTVKKLVDSKDGLQGMLDASDCVLKAPAFVYAPDGHAYALSQGYGPTTHWHWAEIIANRGITSKRIRALRDSVDLPEVWKDSYPRTRRSAMGTHAYMHCSLKPHGVMAGHFVLFGFEKPFYRGLERVVDVLVKAMTKHMEQFYWMYNPSSQLTDAVARFLGDGTFDADEVGLLLRALRWNPDDGYRVHVVRERSPQQPVLLSQLLSDVSRKLPFVISLIHDDALVVVENASRSAENGDAASRLASLLQADFAHGISMLREGIVHCRDLFKQAKREADFCVLAGLAQSRAEERCYERMLEALCRDDMLGTYVHPALVRLREYDDAHDSSFYESLRAYIMTSFHLSDAARYLGLHRNSLDYRLRRVREIVDISDIDALAVNPDEAGFMYVLMSCAIIDARAMTQNS